MSSRLKVPHRGGDKMTDEVLYWAFMLDTKEAFEKVKK